MSRLGIATVFATLTLVGAAPAHAGLPSDGTIKNNVSKNLNKKYKWKAPTLLPGKWMMSHEKVSTLVAPDTASRTFEVQSKRLKDGTNLYFRGNIMYRRVATGKDRWRYDRLFFFEDATRVQGAKPPPAAQLEAMAMQGLDPQASGDRRSGLGNLEAITHFYGMKLPADNGWYMSWFDSMHFKAAFEVDRVQGRRYLERVRAEFWVQCVKQDDGTWRVKNLKRIGEFRQISRDKFEDYEILRMPRLSSTPLAQLSGPERVLPEPVRPTAEQLVPAVVAYYTDRGNIRKALPEGVVSVDAIEIAPLAEGQDVNPFGFHMKGVFRYRAKRNNHGNWKLVIAQRGFKLSFEMNPDGSFRATSVGPDVYSQEKVLDTLSDDDSLVQGTPDIHDKLARGEAVAPTGDTGPAQVPGPKADQLGTAIGAYANSADTFRKMFGDKVYSTGVKLVGLSVGKSGLRRLSYNRFEVEIDVVWHGKRFDGAVLEYHQSYRMVLQGDGKAYAVVNSTPRGRLVEAGKVQVKGGKTDDKQTFEQRFASNGKL